MFEECLEVFNKVFKSEQQKEDAIISTYMPAEGTYIIVDRNENLKVVNIVLDRKTKKINKSSMYFRDICFYDYYSKLISMDKPIKNKMIHSNSYLSFAVKKENIIKRKLTEDIIEEYYKILENPLKHKYGKLKEASKIYEDFEQKNGTVDLEFLRKNKAWIKQNIFNLNELVEVDMAKKDYLKIFFETDSKEYIKEAQRYIYLNIYNKNKYNIDIKNKVYGVPNNNYGMNDKKPFLSIKTRKIPTGYLLNHEEVLLQKQFFDYLMNLASAGKNNVYIDTIGKEINCYNDKDERKNNEIVQSGYYLRLKKGTELEIQVQDNIVDYRNKLATYFEFKDIAGIKFKNIADYNNNYKEYTTRIGLGKLINNVFFSKFLINNYFVDASDISINDSILKRSIITYRDLIFDWVYKGIDNNFAEAVEKFSMDLIKNSVLNDNKIRGVLQLNLRWSLREYFKQNKGGDKMADIVADLRKIMKEKILNKNEVIMPVNDREYYYGIGQLMAYFISLSRANKKTQSMINPVINAKTDRIIKDRLLQLYKKYNYDMLTNNYRVKNLYAMILGYKPEGKIDQEMILFGYMDNNLIYTKEDK